MLFQQEQDSRMSSWTGSQIRQGRMETVGVTVSTNAEGLLGPAPTQGLQTRVLALTD